MKSLESDIRELILHIASEISYIYAQRRQIDDHDFEKLDQLKNREERLAKLSSLCILNIDREIDFFRNN